MDDDDDEVKKLVQEVIAENPVEEKGEREEWAARVGWHRKEDVYGRGGALRGGRNTNIQSQPESPTTSDNRQEDLFSLPPPKNPFVLACLAFFVLACIGFRRRHSGKSRTQ
eukprot:scaffold6503_cov99-Amphora_coffeaeformis.AAC.4